MVHPVEKDPSSLKKSPLYCREISGLFSDRGPLFSKKGPSLNSSLSFLEKGLLFLRERDFEKYSSVDS